MNKKVLFVSMMHDYGIKERDFSYGYYHMYGTLKHMFGDNAIFFDFLDYYYEHGKSKMNERLLEVVKSEKPDMAIFSLYRDEFEAETLKNIRNYTKTLCYFWDDQWRVEYSKKWAPHFDYITTPDYDGIRKWRDRGYNDVIYSPFGFNHIYFKNNNIPMKYDVSFVGMKHPYRKWIIKYLENKGIKVNVAGYGWKKGFISYAETAEIFNSSRINLNLSNSTSYDLRYVLSSPGALRDTLNNLFSTKDYKNVEQIKGRHFEIPGCGGFQLSYFISGLEHCYEIGKEICIYTDINDLMENIRYYLTHEEERKAIAEAGYKRTISEHTYEKRFSEIFAKMGL